MVCLDGKLLSALLFQDDGLCLRFFRFVGVECCQVFRCRCPVLSALLHFFLTYTFIYIVKIKIFCSIDVKKNRKHYSNGGRLDENLVSSSRN